MEYHQYDYILSLAFQKNVFDLVIYVNIFQ